MAIPQQKRFNLKRAFSLAVTESCLSVRAPKRAPNARTAPKQGSGAVAALFQRRESLFWRQHHQHLAAFHARMLLDLGGLGDVGLHPL